MTPAAAPAAAERHHDRSAPSGAAAGSREPGPTPDLGNQAMQALAAGRLRGGWEIGGADNPEEREADRLAKAAVSGPRPTPCACGGRCPSCTGTAKLRRKAEDGAPLRRPARVPDLGNSAGRSLDAATRHHFEPRFGLDLGAVRIHDDPATAHLARGIGARAFIIGDQIGFAAGRHRLGTGEGRALLAHELAHVALGHGGVRRVEDSDLAAQAEWREQQEKARAEAAKRHEAWSGAVDKRFGSDLTGQSKMIGEERQRLDLAITAQRAAAFDAAAGGEGWLAGALKDQGYGGPDLATVRQLWGEALVAAEGLALSDVADGPDSVAKLGALDAVPAFYDSLKGLAAAVEFAHQTRHDAAVATAKADYERRLKAYEDAKASDRATRGPIGEPGERAARAGQAIMRGLPPAMAAVSDPPKPISAGVDAARSRIYAAQTGADWQAVTADVRGLGAGLSKLVVSTLPKTSEARQAVEYAEALDERLAEFEGKNAVVWRIPATFYPLDKLNTKTGEDGKEVQTPRVRSPGNFISPTPASRPWTSRRGRAANGC